MILVHPTVTHSPSKLLRLQVRTGLRFVMGQTYLRLVNRDGSTPKCKTNKNVSALVQNNDWDGGSAA